MGFANKRSKGQYFSTVTVRIVIVTPDLQTPQIIL